MTGSGGNNVASTSTSAEPASADHREIEALFDWNPPRLISISQKSTTTRPPPFYDKHFSKDLVLRHVKRLPSLVHDLARNVDSALLAASKSLPPPVHEITADHREFIIEEMPKVVRNKQGVAEYYQQTTAQFCARVASTLALHPQASTSRWRSLLVWSQSNRSSHYVIMDGELRFKDWNRGEPYVQTIMNSMDPETREIVEEMKESGTSFGSWVLNSITAGSDNVLKAVLNLGEFTWTYCDKDCPPAHQKWKDKVNNVVVGPDAQHPLWNFNGNGNGDDDGGDGGNDDGDEVFKDQHDITAQSLVQQVNCNIVAYEIMLIDFM